MALTFMREDNVLRVPFVVGTLMIVATVFQTAFAWADGSGDAAVVKNVNGKYEDKNGTPTFHIGPDGTVDWYTYSGFRRYHSDCHVCHGPDGEGSTYAPALKESLKRLSYDDFVGVIASGRQRVNAAQESVMPAFGTNPNVMCYIDDLFVYLRARANDALPRGRPAKREDKPEAAKQQEDACLPKQQ
jgi:methanol metabolism-related c-type cytochrome